MDFEQWIWCVRAQLASRAEGMSYNKGFKENFSRHAISKQPVSEEVVSAREQLRRNRAAQQSS